MNFIFDQIGNWIREILVSGILGNLSGLFNDVNNQVGSVAIEVGKTPSSWNPGVFSMVRSLSESVILPIAGLILTAVMCYELINMIIEKNNMHDLDTFMIFRWIFKTCIAVFLVSHTFDLVLGVFDMSQSIVQQSIGAIGGSGAVDISSALVVLEEQLMSANIGALLTLYLQSMFIGFATIALNICIMLVIYGRMLEIYLMISIAPIPIATFVNREWNFGQNYLKSILGLAFQAFLILVCIGIYAALVSSIAFSGNPINAIWTCVGYTVLLCYGLFKTGSLAKAIFMAH